MDLEFSFDTFAAAIQSLPDVGYAEQLDAILTSAIQWEEGLRRRFAASPQHEPDLPALDTYAGLIDIFSVPESMRLARPRSWTEPMFELLINGKEGDFFPPKHLFCLPEDLQNQPGSLFTVPSYDHFIHQWNFFSNNAFSTISDWSNILIAGGSVLACLLPVSASSVNSRLASRREMGRHFQDLYEEADIDIFFYGLDADQAHRRMETFAEEISSNLPHESIFVRRASSITIRTNGDDTRPIQFVLRLYTSPAEVITGFDVDCSCCAFNGQQIFVNSRALVALMRQCNTVDMTRRSTSYEVRLQKYAKRGFEVYVPSLQRERIDYKKVYDRKQSVFPNGLARLLVYEYLRYDLSFFPRLRAALYGRNRRRATKLFPGSFLDFTPMHEDNNYDKVWGRIPSHWDIQRVITHINAMDRAMNSSWKMRKFSRETHRHYMAWASEITDVLDFCCDLKDNCPEPTTERDTGLVEEEIASGVYIRGKVTFTTQNPGAQLMTGSFRPITIGDWEMGVYLHDGEPQAVPGFQRRYGSAWRYYVKMILP